MNYKAQRSNAVTRLLVRPPIPRGVYLWGGVGRGKSLLMDCFYAAVPVVRKTRLHFHEFMRGVHQELDAVKGTANPLDEVGYRVARRYRLICFDEFHVSDIADAMILHRLLQRLFDLRVGFVMTSNYRRTVCIRMACIGTACCRPSNCSRRGSMSCRSMADRTTACARSRKSRPISSAAVRFADAHMQDAFEKIVECADENPVLRIESREIRARRRAGGRGLVRFLGAVRRAAFAQRLPGDCLAVSHGAAVRRAAHVGRPVLRGAPLHLAGGHLVRPPRQADRLGGRAPTQLYTAGALSQEFQRTASRLIEMQSREYSAAPRRAAGAIVPA
jgi:cell division protein ZapE